MKTNDSDDRGIFSTGTSVSDSSAWFLSLIRQFREFRAERLHPTPHVEITAERDPSALDKLVDPPSQIASLISSVRAVIHDAFHPHRIETTATPIEVEEIWSKRKYGVPGVLSLIAHVGVVGLFVYLSIASQLKPKSVTNTSVLMEPIALSLPPSAVKSGGGGGGGVKAPTPASKGVLPKSAPVQFVPPTPIPASMVSEVMMEPTIIANLPKSGLISPIGDPNGVLGPPSAGPGTGFGIGNGDGHGVGTGNGPGAGPGSGGGFGGGVYRGGSGPGVVAPKCSFTPEPNYSDDARKAHIQGDVVLSTIVQTDGKVDVAKVVQSLGYGLDEEAKKVLSKWKCSPGKIDGQTSAFALQIVIKFHLY